MSITTPLIDIAQLYSLPFPSTLSMVVAEIAEIMPAAPATGGSRQQIRIRAPGSIHIDVHLFDQATSLPMQAMGSLIRLSASPNAVRALVWERSKAAKPSANVGAIVVRKQALVEVIRREQAAMVGITSLGAVVATPTQGAQPLVAAPAATARVPDAIQQSQRVDAPVPTDSSAIEIARRFGECLSAARSVLGPQADGEDIRMTARVIYDEKFGRRAVA